MTRAGSLLVLNVAELLRVPGITKDVHLEPTRVDLGLDDRRIDDGPVVVALHLDVLTDGIVVRGTVSASWQGMCRRCLGAARGRIDAEVDELYQVVLRDPEAFPIVHEQIDLGPMVRETLLIDVPEAPLCSDDCAGLCPVCGTDRNVAPCTCDTTVRDERWSALDALKPDSR